MEHSKKKLGPYLLSGLIIGPILGSGIIILPPIIHEVAGDFAIIAWSIMMGMSFLFAYVFGRLSILFPGDSGAAHAVEEAFGKPFRILAANFLILAVCIGPIAVLSTAGDYLAQWTNLKSGWLTLGLLLLSYGIVSMNITSVGRLSLILSSLISLILVSGGIVSLLFYRQNPGFSAPMDFPAFGYSLLLLFWCLVGWEIIGNYSGEVKNPAKTIPAAIRFSILIITLVSLTVAAAIQWTDAAQVSHGASGKLDLILIPLYGSYALPVMALVTTALCISTALMVIGGVSRLICAQSEQGIFPSFLSIRTRKNIPIAAMSALFLVHLVTFGSVQLGLVSLQQLVAVADGFFLCNALTGILAAFRLIKERTVRVIASLLAASFLSILLFSEKWVLAFITLMVIGTLYKVTQEKKSNEGFKIEQSG